MKDSTKPSRAKKTDGRGLDGRGSAVGVGPGDGKKPAGRKAGGAPDGDGTSASPAPPQERVTLRLYVAGQTPRSLAALANLRKVCDEYLAPKFKIELEVVDLLEQPQLAQADQIFAIPTLVRKLPSPIKRIIGDLSNTERVLIGLDIHGGK